MKTINVHDAVGTILCHDITRIVPGQAKGPIFSKGHTVREEDIPVLLDIGKEHLYVFEQTPGFVHENDAARRIVKACAGQGLAFSEPKEGRINMLAAYTGLLHIDVAMLNKVNSIGEITIATLHSLQMVQKNQELAGTRVIPLLIGEEQLITLENMVTKPIIEVLPLKSAKVGIVTTGSEVFHGRIKDSFGPILKDKFAYLGCSILGQTLSNDDITMTSQAIQDFLSQGANVVVVTGGMSVDPDDKTPAAIRKSTTTVVCYGAPVYPGAMFMLAFADCPQGRVPVLGLPGCVMYHKASIFDLLMPQLLAGLDVTAANIASMGHGSFCSGCGQCHFPICPFGKYL